MHTSRHPSGMYLVTLHESNVTTINRDRWTAWQQATYEYWFYHKVTKTCPVTPIHPLTPSGANHER